jgi:pimeloyl-ACP methyl ester carboxylesterase
LQLYLGKVIDSKKGSKSMHSFFLVLFSLLMFTGCELPMKMEVKKAKIGDVELAYYTRGAGEPLVMIMGFRGTMSGWDPALLDILEKKYTLILFDHRGVGFSTDTQDDMTTVPQMAEDTAGLIRSLGYAKAHILGWSMGTRIALELSLKHPELVETMILCSPNPGGEHQAKRKTGAFAKLTAPVISNEEAISLIFPDTVKGKAAGAVYQGRIAAQVIAGKVPNDFNVSKQTVERQVRAIKVWDEGNHLYDALPTVKVPTLVTGGLSDVLDGPDNVRTVASRIPNAWTAYFPNAGHNFLSQDHQSFGDLALLFIETNKGLTP